jgi:hypothetical protein
MDHSQGHADTGDARDTEGARVTGGAWDTGDDWSPAHQAIELGDLLALASVLDSGADAEDPDEQGMTLLLHAIAVESDAAAETGEPPQVDITALLLARGADPERRDAIGRTPAQVAELAGHWLAAELLRAWWSRQSSRRREHEDSRSAGRRLLESGATTLVHSSAILEQTTGELRHAGYRVITADASRWLTAERMHQELARLLEFPGYYGKNLDAFNDCLGDVAVDADGFLKDWAGLVLVLTGFDTFAERFPDQAHGLLDVIEIQSRHALLNGAHLICLVQSGDPRLVLPSVGARPVVWNNAEWSDRNRGL